MKALLIKVLAAPAMPCAVQPVAQAPVRYPGGATKGELLIRAARRAKNTRPGTPAAALLAGSPQPAANTSRTPCL